MFDFFESYVFANNVLPNKKNPKRDVIGNFYYFVEPTFVNVEGYHTTTVILSVYDSSKKAIELDFTVKWAKMLGDKGFLMEDYEERHYHFTPSDIGLKIRASITCKDPKYAGVAYIYFGPIDLDISLVPEIEGMFLNMKGNFKTRILAQNGIPFNPNDSLLTIDRPYLTITFDKALEGKYKVNGQPSFVPMVFNFEATKGLKVRVDNCSTTNIFLSYKEENQEECKLTLQFDSRHLRDSFYIFLRLLRSIKSTFFEKLNSNYEELLKASWCLTNQDLSEDEDDPEGEYGYFELLHYDNIREHLRELIRHQHDLNLENISLGDCLTILEDDLDNCTRQFRSLLEEGKKGRPKNLAKYEKSRSALGELSLSILDDVKRGNKKKVEHYTSPEVIANLEEEIKAYKDSSLKIRKELETLKEIEGNRAPPTMGDSTLVDSDD